MKSSSARSGAIAYTHDCLVALGLDRPCRLRRNPGRGPAGPGDGGSGQTGPTGPTGPADVPIALGGDVKNVGTGRADRAADCRHRHAGRDDRQCSDHRQQARHRYHGQDRQRRCRARPGGDHLRLGVAKLVPAAGGLPSRWQNYINRNGAEHHHPGADERRPGKHRERRRCRLAGSWGGQVPLYLRGRPQQGHDADRGEL